ncbi:hypothetical protein TMatcc_001230 [Talaromyces marneffei ATCC 18224]|uniref:Uncharacterized protein n=1 Tax=Talaromyces marneffei (strain ATCC 18224 / CBS 334.59 / QM 7333) TaxID=441960 RepID=B6QWM0_TALMQ|nr:hypothetical protein PMAA_102590 [Talaromyces marneffei ATCC 18224]
MSGINLNITTMAVSLQARYDKLCAVYYSLLVQLSGYRLIRISDLGHTDVVNILSLRQHPLWSRIELNDGSWEFCLPLDYIDNFQKLVRKHSSAKIDLQYNPLLVPKHDFTYFDGFPTAYSMNGVWLKARAENIYRIPRDFYTSLIDFQELISEELNR